MGELWAVPLMLRMRLIEALHVLSLAVYQRQRESQQATFWANRLLHAARRDPDRLLELIGILSQSVPNPSPHFADHLVRHLYDEEAALTPVRSWMEKRLGSTLVDISRLIERRQAVERVSLANAITSLRLLTQINWNELFESVSHVDALLATDPAGVYSNMDFQTRDRYRHTVERIARGAQKGELDIANAAIKLAENSVIPRQRHVGYYLIEDGYLALETQMGYKNSLGTLI